MTEIEPRGLDEIAGQVVVVTGGAGVIGRAICEAFGRAGAAVVVADLAEGPRQDLVAAVQKAGGRALGVHLDVANRESVEAMVESVEREFGPIDLLINNAGLLGAIGPIWEVDPEEWWRVWEVNVRGSMLCARAVLRSMVTRRKGRIINMSSGSVLGPSHAFSAYPVSKTAITRLTEHLALDAREYGISVFAITPGLVDTPLARQTYQSAAGMKWTSQYRDVYRERQVPPELAAERCVELASGRADALSGCYIQLADNIDEFVSRSELIAAEGLYTLRIRGETATPITPRVADMGIT
jgi:NAD(P)-dependent dehydrogenase (short-subunit alcohol dehydrogenase family)